MGNIRPRWETPMKVILMNTPGNRNQDELTMYTEFSEPINPDRPSHSKWEVAVRTPSPTKSEAKPKQSGEN